MFSVKFGEKFLLEFRHFPVEDKRKIIQFVDHVRQHGFLNLEGRKKQTIR